MLTIEQLNETEPEDDYDYDVPRPERVFDMCECYDEKLKTDRMMPKFYSPQPDTLKIEEFMYGDYMITHFLDYRYYPTLKLEGWTAYDNFYGEFMDVYVEDVYKAEYGFRTYKYVLRLVGEQTKNAVMVTLTKKIPPDVEVRASSSYKTPIEMWKETT